MSTGPYYAVITAAHTSLSGRPMEPRRVFRAGDGIQLNIVHQFIPWDTPVPAPPLHYRAIAILQNYSQAGFFQRVDGEVVYQLERGIFAEGAYTDTNSLVTFFDLGPVPADPAAAYDTRFRAARAIINTRAAVVQELMLGDHGVEFMPGLWSFQPILLLRATEGASRATDAIDFRTWEPWTYIVRP